MTGAQALVRSMKREGIRVVFGVPGAGQYEAVDAIWETPDVRYFGVRHEQATSYMADGYARAGGGIAGIIVVPGPGLCNALAGMATASDASSPMLVVTGKHPFGDTVPRDESDWWVAKWVARIDRPAETPEIVQEAMRRMKTGRPGPVLLQVPQSTLTASEDVDLLQPQVYMTPSADANRIGQAAQLLLDSRAPLILAGGGVHSANAAAELLRVAERLQAPVVTSTTGKGAVSDDHPLALGYAELEYPPLREFLWKRDLVLAIGTRTRFEDRPGSQRFLRVDIEERRATGSGPPDLGITGDARAVLAALYQALCSAPAREDSVSQEIASLRRERFAPHNQLEPQRSLMNAVRKALPHDGIVVQGMTQMGYYSRNYLPMYASRTYLTASYHGTLGHAFPLGLGAKIARPARPVVVISGDGGFLYNSQELATAVQHRIPVVAIVFNDNAYGNVLRAQQEEFKGHVLGSRLHNPDFVRLALSYGARGVRAEGAARLGAELEEALRQETPTLIEVPVGEMERVY